MFKNSKAFSSFSVDDIAVAKKFYSETLGLEVKEMSEMGVLELYTNGNSPIMIYPKDNHEPATHTVLNFPVEDIEKTVNELKAKGVTFEHYTGELQTDDSGINRNGPGPLMAWFKDPAGNFIALLQGK